VNWTGAPGLPAKDAAPARVWGSCPPPAALENEPDRRAGSGWKPDGPGNRLGLGLSVLRSWIVKLPWRWPPVRSGMRRASVRGSGPPRSAMEAEAAGWWSPF